MAIGRQDNEPIDARAYAASEGKKKMAAGAAEVAQEQRASQAPSSSSAPDKKIEVQPGTGSSLPMPS